MYPHVHPSTLITLLPAASSSPQTARGTRDRDSDEDESTYSLGEAIGYLAWVWRTSPRTLYRYRTHEELRARGIRKRPDTRGRPRTRVRIPEQRILDVQAEFLTPDYRAAVRGAGAAWRQALRVYVAHIHKRASHERPRRTGSAATVSDAFDS